MNESTICCKTYKAKVSGSERIKPPFDEETAVKLARQCLSNVICDNCDLCRYLCPDLCITRNPDSGHIEIDLTYCKGCGICAYICPKSAISMQQS